MSSWQLEVFRMALYVMFPVGMFHYFNQPENYDNWVTKKHAERYDPKKQEQTKILKEFIEDYKEKAELQRLNALEKEYNKSNMKM